MVMFTFAPRLVRAAAYALMAGVALHMLHGVGGVDVGVPEGVFEMDLQRGAHRRGAHLRCAGGARARRASRVGADQHRPARVECGGRLLHRGPVEAGGPPYPSISDGGWLLYYPAIWVAVLVLMRRRIREFHASLWLDGIVAALAMAACAAALVLPPILAMSLEGDAAAVAVNLAYPAGDLLLIAMLLGALALTGWRPDRSSHCSGSACSSAGWPTSAISTRSRREYVAPAGPPRCGRRRRW